MSITRYSVSKLRANLYRVLDEVLTTGAPVEVERRGRIIKIVPETKPGKLTNLEPHPDYIKVDPESIVHMDWTSEWRP